MMKATLAAVAASLGLALGGCVGGDFGTPFQASVDETRPLDAAGELSLENTNGRVRVAAWDEPRVRIEAVKHAATERGLDELKVEIEGEGSRVAVRTRHPRGGWLGGGGKVDYRVSVPRGARVRVGTVNGRVEVDGVAGTVRASTVNGSVEGARLGGEVEASAVNGSVEVALERVAPSGRSRLSTTNGSVRLTLPRDASADVEARTVNGSVRCDFDLDGARKTRKKVEGRIGGGGARFELATVNGSARIDRGLSSPASRTPVEVEPGQSDR
jgi:hypothetical protein